MKIVPFSIAVLAVLTTMASCGNKPVAEKVSLTNQWDVSVRITDMEMDKPHYEALVHGANGETKQVLEGNTSDYPKEMLETFGNVWQADVNFDGHTDVMICLGKMPTSEEAITLYDAWLYDPQTDQFNFHKGFRLIFNPEVDADNKCVIGSYRLHKSKKRHYTAYTLEADSDLKKVKEWEGK